MLKTGSGLADTLIFVGYFENCCQNGSPVIDQRTFFWNLFATFQANNGAAHLNCTVNCISPPLIVNRARLRLWLSLEQVGSLFLPIYMYLQILREFLR